MTRRLGGIQSRSLAALASLSLAAGLACGMTTMGCSSDNSSTQTMDAGEGGGSSSGGSSSSGSSSGGMDAGGSSSSSGGSSSGMTDAKAPDTGTPVPDAGMPPPKCATPTFSPNGGMVLANSTTTISATGLSATGVILYTTDGSIPTRGAATTKFLTGAAGGAVQITQSETISAIASDPGVCTESTTPVTATFTIITPDGGSLTAPGFNPTATTQNNDFSVALSSTAGTTICYTTDGTTMPSCASGGACGSGSKAYMGGGVAINSTVTNATTGKVTVSAIACSAAAGTANSTVVSQAYTLQVAAPVMAAPDNAKPVMYVSGGTSATPTISDTTNGATVRYFTGSNTPDCGLGTGTQLTPPYLLGSQGGPLGAITQNTLFQLVGCKQGYAPSAVTPIQYWVQLNQPTFPQPGAMTYHTNTVTSVVSDSANTGSSDWMCWTSDNSTPTCTATGCGHGTASTTTAPQVTATGQQINVVACVASNGTTNSGYQNSAVPDSSGVYTLQLNPVYFSPQPGAGASSYTFLASDANPFAISVGESSAGTTADYVCIGNAMPVDCTCNTATGHGTATTVNAAVAGGATPTAPNNVWIGVACSLDTTVILNSGTTTASYNPVGSATAPTIAPASGNYMAQQTIVLTNAADVTSTLCWTTDGSNPAVSAAPACASTNGPITTCKTGVASAASYSVPAQIGATNNTIVKAVACNASEAVSPTPSQATYTFSLAEPTVSTTTSYKGDLDANGSLVGGNDKIYFNTTSDFGGEWLNWSDNGSTVNCTTAQNTAPAGASFTYTVPQGATSVTLNIIACGTGQVASAVRSVTLSVATSTPTITNSAKPSVNNLTWENTFQATIATTTTGATICYRLDGTTPTCNAGMCDLGANTHPVNASSTTITIDATGTGLVAVACTGTLASNGMASANYTLNVTPVTIGSTGTCPLTYSISLAADSSGGATTGATLCYSTTGAFTYSGCSGGTPPTGVTCGAYTAPVALAPISSSGNVWVTTCETGFVGDPGSMHATAVTPDTNTGITVNGTPDTGEWPSGNTLAGSGGVTGYYATDGTSLFFAVGGYTPAAGTDVVIFLGDGNGTGSTTGPATFGNAAPGFAAKMAISWPTSGTATTPAAVAAWSGTAWGTSSTAVTVGFTAGNFVEFSIPLSALGTLTAPATVDVSGDVVIRVGSSPASSGHWPSGSFVADVLSSCAAPNPTEIQ